MADKSAVTGDGIDSDERDRLIFEALNSGDHETVRRLHEGRPTPQVVEQEVVDGG